MVDADALATMHDIDPDTGLGPASYGYCPCTVDPDGTAHYRWIGHSGGTTQLVYSAEADLTIVINVTDSLWLPDRGRAIAELVETLRTVMLDARTPTSLPGFGASGATGPKTTTTGR